MQQALINATTSKQILCPIWRRDVDVTQLDVRADVRIAADHVTGDRRVLVTRRALEVAHRDVADGEIRWKLVAQGQIILAVALRDFDGVVNVLDLVAFVCDAVHSARTATALEVAGES